MDILDKKEVLRKIQTELKISGMSKRTIQIYSDYNSKFLDFINKDPLEITKDDIKSYLAEIIDKNESSSVALVTSALRYFYDGILEKGLMLKIKTPKYHRKLPDVLTRQEIQLILDNSGSLRNKLLIELMYASGLRVSEVASLKVSEINIPEKKGHLKHGKGNKERFFITSNKLLKDLSNYLESRKMDTEYLFPGKTGHIKTRAIQRVIERVAIRSGIKKHVHCHGFRHAFATHLLENGTDIRFIQELLGHINLQTTQFYTTIKEDTLRKVKSPLDEEK